MWHQPCQRCKYTTAVYIKKTRYKKLVTHAESHASAVSLLKRAEKALYKRASINQKRGLSDTEHFDQNCPVLGKAGGRRTEADRGHHEISAQICLSESERTCPKTFHYFYAMIDDDAGN